jgi:hypothetical protein
MIKKIFKNKIFLLFLLFLSVFLVYFLTGPVQPTPYNYFVRLANAFSHGQIYLTEAPPWLNELIPLEGKYFVVYPPMPAILLLPFAFFLGPNLNQTLFSNFIGALNVILLFLILGKMKINKKAQIWLTALFAMGTNHWFLASIGSAWYLAHIVAVFFILLAIREILGSKRALFIGLFLGAAFWSRLPTILAFPFFAVLLWQKNNLKPLFKLALGVAFFVCLNFLYNFIRFQTIFDVGYTLIPGVLNEPWSKLGLFNVHYLPRHLKILFLKLPLFSHSFPYLKPSNEGLALWLTTPAFIFALKAKIRQKIVWAAWLAIFLIAIPNLIHSTVGFSQFGYRFAMDFTPFLILLTAIGIKQKLKWYHQFLIITGIIINFWGVLWINKFGWVGW